MQFILILLFVTLINTVFAEDEAPVPSTPPAEIVTSPTEATDSGGVTENPVDETESPIAAEADGAEAPPPITQKGKSRKYRDKDTEGTQAPHT
ncbi:hypothetical protein WHJ47_14365, partial [Staphylococcus aureus]|uniref:hypothetical protein n=1 Tax=Staphylococcus aureus TaxID=1280 RepID=UPI0039BDFCAF